jgi:archaellum component FlaC
VTSLDRIAERVRRIEQQIRSLRDLHASEQREVAQKVEAIARIHAEEMELILDELADVAADLDAATAAATDGTSAPVDADDPAATSPKRAKWLAEQEERAHRSRRELLRGRDPG